MHTLTAGLRYLDLNFMGTPQVIATAVLDGPGGVALVDPGPGSCFARLEAGLREAGVGLDDVTTVLLTHIHLDHAGASGSLVARNPRIQVYVHERGARHMIDPARLLESASRLYGDQMQRLWGEFLAVPAANVHALSGGERVEAGGRSFEVAYTPGHASHHVCYHDADSRIALVGDTAGVRIGGGAFTMPPTPPPDVDLAAWRASAARILAWRPQTLFLTHFGPIHSPEEQLGTMLERLERHADLVRRGMAPDRTDAEQAEAFRVAMAGELRQHMTEAEALSYELAVPLDHCYLGLARYWRKQQERPA